MQDNREIEYCYEITPNGKRIRHEVGPSFTDIPKSATIRIPLCKACLKHDEESWRCDIFGEMPKVYRQCKKYDCPHFKADKQNDFYKDVVKEIEKEKQA